MTLSIEGLLILGLITLILISDIIFDAAFLNNNPQAFSWELPLGASLYTLFSGFLDYGLDDLPEDESRWVFKITTSHFEEIRNRQILERSKRKRIEEFIPRK